MIINRNLLRAATIASVLGLVAPATAIAGTIKLPEGKEVSIRIEDDLSSATASEGDQFAISLNDDVKLSDGTVLHSGYRGKGEVVSAKKKGFMGQPGELNIRLSYIRVGDTRVRLSASKGSEGKGAMGATVALSVLFGPLGLLKHGHDVEIKKGMTLTAFVDGDAELDTPVAPPPVLD